MLAAIALCHILPPVLAGELAPVADSIRAASAAKPAVITEWRVPWEKSRPRDPYVDASGRVWFVGQAGNYVAYLDPASGDFRRYEIPEGTHPHNLIVDGAGQVWYAGNRNGHIGRLDPATGRITRFPMPEGVRDPHTLILGRDGQLWFTAQSANRIGRLDTRTGTVSLVAPSVNRARPYGIVLDADGRPWVALFGTNRLASVDPATMRLREYVLPHEQTLPRRIAVTPDGMVWYVDYRRGFLGRLDPATGDVREWPNPSGAGSMPYAMASDDAGRLWYVETGVRPNRLVGFDPATQRVVSETPIGETDAPNTVRHMIYHAPTRSIWFGTDANTIGRARLP